MAESSAATQSPSVSSSSSGTEPPAPGGGSPGACPALGPKSCGSSCADSFVSCSSSQPVSLFATSQEGLSSLSSDEPPSEIMTSSHFSSEIHKTDHTLLLGEKSKMVGSQPVSAKEGNDLAAHLDVQGLEKPQETSKDTVDSPAPVSAGAPGNPSPVAASSPDHTAFLSKEAAQMEQQKNENQEPKNPNQELTRGDNATVATNDRFTLLPAQKPPTELSKATGVCSYSLSPSEVTGNSSLEKDSPESPFEVIIDKATFDREFKDSYKESANDFGSWAAPGERESAADVLESDDKVFPLRSQAAGRYPASALRPGQFSHTNAALEEVSRCVNDMHNFTNEILTWDLVPRVKPQSDKSDRTPRTTGPDRSGCDSEIPVVNLKANTHQRIPVCSVNGSAPTAASTGDTQEKAVIKKAAADSPSGTKEIIAGTPGVARKQGDTLPESLGSGVSPVKLVLPEDRAKAETPWQNSVLGDVAEADSSGESDDTVIEDGTTDTAFENNSIEAEEAVAVSCAVVKPGQQEVGETPTCGPVNRASGMWEGLAGESACSQVPERNVQSEDGKQLGGHVSKAVPENPVKAGNPKLPSAASPNVFNNTESPLNVKSSAYLELLHDESVKDIDDSSPEDLAFAEDGEKGLVEEGEGATLGAESEKRADAKAILSAGALRQHELLGSENDDKKNHCIEQSKGKEGSGLVGAFQSQDTPVASLDLEQEQLTIRALRELSERQGEESASAQDGGESPGETLKPASSSAPESWPQRPRDALGHTVVRTGSDLGLSKNPTVVKEATNVDAVSSLSESELVREHTLARLLADVSVHDLIFWRDVKKTGVVFGTTLVLLLSLAAFSVISVASYLILALLSVTISFRVYKSVIQAVQKSEEGHPFKACLDADITLSSEAFHNYMNAAMVHINKALKLVIRLFLVEDLVDSLKLAVFMWLMTYVGAVFNGITLLILAELLVFSVPVVYEKYKTQIDHYVGIIRDQTKSVAEKIQAKLPGIAKKKAE